MKLTLSNDFDYYQKRYIELGNFLRKTLMIVRARIRHLSKIEFFQIVAIIFDKTSRNVQHIFLFSWEKKASISFQRWKLSWGEIALNFSFSFVVKINRRRRKTNTTMPTFLIETRNHGTLNENHYQGIHIEDEGLAQSNDR